MAGKRIPFAAALCASLCAAPSWAQRSGPAPVVDPEPTRACLEAGPAEACIGLAARSCIAALAADDLGWSDHCYRGEVGFWRGRIDAAENRLYLLLRHRDDTAGFAANEGPGLRVFIAEREGWGRKDGDICAGDRRAAGQPRPNSLERAECALVAASSRALGLEARLGREAP